WFGASSDVPAPLQGPAASLRAVGGSGVLLLSAGELGAQGRERLVAGQRAAGRGSAAVAGRGRLATGVVATGRGLGVGLLGRRDLLAVRLEAGLGLGVLPLPRLAGLVVALEPLAGLRVEALGVDVVALLVVGRGHAVGGRVELVVLA